MRSLLRRPSPALIVAMVALIVALSGSAYAIETIDGKLIKNRSISGIKLKSHTISGNEVRASTLFGCPSGTRFFVGVCVENALRGGDKNWTDSAAVCKAVGRRLPTVGELWLFRNQPGITLGGSAANREWAIEVVDSGHHVSVNDAGGNSLTPNATPLPYRCVAAPRP